MNQTITINDRPVVFTPGQTILEAATAARSEIPTLCYMEETGHRDVCRICVVELRGSDHLVPSCSTAAVAGMEILTDSGRVIESRRQTIRMLLANGRHNVGQDIFPT